MEFLWELFGGGTLTYDQLAAKVTEKQMKLADLSGGAYVGKDKFDTLAEERNDYKRRLEEANGKLQGYDPDWKTKAEQAQQEADAKIKAMARTQALKEKTAGLKFSSDSARRAFLSDLEAKELPLEDGQVLGFDDFVEKYKKSDPGAFASDTKPPRITATTPGAPGGGSAKDQANAAFRAAFGNQNQS